ncbi:hypothetical protein SPHS8_03656 [Sphingobium sp. S8]|nr:hypothetical protein SPHS8_03656 [Sphingobium sp. S8]
MLHSGLVYWSECFEIPCSGMLQARYVRLRLAEKTYFHLHHIEVNARVYAKFDKPVFVGRRTDGLGERLNALINAIRLSDIFQTDFIFSWSDRLADDPFHAIMPIGRMFSQDFIAKHHVPLADTRGAWEFDNQKQSLAAVEWALCSHGGIAGPRTSLSDHISGAADILHDASPSDAFKRIGFSEEVNEAILLAKTTPIPPEAVAIHLRSGDIFYKDYRKYVHYTYKGMTIPIAKAMIRKFSAEGDSVYIFGEDKEQIEYLSQVCFAVNSSKLNADKTASMERHQKAMYDLVLLSRFKKILSGSSGFARQASWIGGGRLISPNEIFDAEQQHRISIEDLQNNRDKYNSLQTSFGYWHAYYYGRNKRELHNSIDALNNAKIFDPENELYPLILSSLFVMNDDLLESQQVLETLFLDRHATGSLKEIFRIFTAKTLNAYNLQEYFPHFERAALSGSFMHCALMAELSFSKGDETGATAYLERYKAGCSHLKQKLFEAVLAHLENRP